MPSWVVVARRASVLSTVIVLGTAAWVAGQPARPRAAAPPARKLAPAATAKPATPPAAPQPAPAAAAAPAPVPKLTATRLRSRFTASAQVSENTTYFGAGRQRFDFPGMAMIAQCDLNRTIQVSDTSRRYLIHNQSPASTEATAPVSPGAQSTPAKKGGVIAVTVTTTDTGERKTVFGYEARHLTIETVKRPDANACDRHSETISVDGWYIDLPEAAAVCPAASAAPPAAASETPECVDRVDSQIAGGITPGFAVATTLTTVQGDAVDGGKAGGKTDKKADKKNDRNGASGATTVTSLEVVELQNITVEPGFFDVPAGYTEVKVITELFGGGAGATAGVSVSDTLTNALLGSVADGTRTVAPRREGTMRIGVAAPTNTSGRELPGVGMQFGLMTSLNKAPYEAVPLIGDTPADLERDARSKQCDYLLVSGLSELRSEKPGKAGGFLKKVSGDASPGAENHDARVDYKLFAIDTSEKPLLAASAKASSGGGFGLGSALRVAAFAGQMYLGAMTGMAGMGNMGGLASLGLGIGMGGNGLSSAIMGPGMGAAMSMMSQPGLPNGLGGLDGLDPNAAAAERTAGDAFHKAGDAVLDELRKKPSTH